MSNEIYVAVIGGTFTLLTGVILACINKDRNYCSCQNYPNQNAVVSENRTPPRAHSVEIINETHYIPPTQVLNKIYELPDKTTDLKNAKYISHNNGKYIICVPPKSSIMKDKSVTYTDFANVFTIYKQNFGKCTFTLKLSNVIGNVQLFIKRFDDNWKYIDMDTTDAVNGYNSKLIFSRIGQDNISIEQIGLMVNIDNYQYSSCNIDKAKLNFN